MRTRWREELSSASLSHLRRGNCSTTPSAMNYWLTIRSSYRTTGNEKIIPEQQPLPSAWHLYALLAAWIARHRVLSRSCSEVSGSAAKLHIPGSHPSGVSHQAQSLP